MRMILSREIWPLETIPSSVVSITSVHGMTTVALPFSSQTAMQFEMTSGGVSGRMASWIKTISFSERISP